MQAIHPIIFGDDLIFAFFSWSLLNQIIFKFKLLHTQKITKMTDANFVTHKKPLDIWESVSESIHFIFPYSHSTTTHSIPDVIQADQQEEEQGNSLWGPGVCSWWGSNIHSLLGLYDLYIHFNSYRWSQFVNEDLL